MKPRRLLAILLAAAGLSACARELPDISESKARSIAEKELDQYCGGEGGKCTDYYSKGLISSPDDRFKWAFRWISEFTDLRRELIIMVSTKGETSVMMKNLPPMTAEELAAVSATSPPPAEGAPFEPAPPAEAN